jgi:hypothetical protein
MDIDGDGVPDNKLGTAIAQVQSLQMNLQKLVDAVIARGEAVMLVDVRATSLEQADQSVAWFLRGATPSPPPCKDRFDVATCGQHLTGAGNFTISAEDARTSFSVGKISGGRFVGGPNRVHVAVGLVEGAPPLVLDLVGARADMQTGAVLMGARLAGAVPQADVERALIPAVYAAVAETARHNCHGEPPNCCTPDTPGAALHRLFDTDKNCEITLNEFRTHPFVASVFTPDLKDALSFGLSFDAVAARFPAPN